MFTFVNQWFKRDGCKNTLESRKSRKSKFIPLHNWFYKNVLISVMIQIVALVMSKHVKLSFYDYFSPDFVLNPLLAFATSLVAILEFIRPSLLTYYCFFSLVFFFFMDGGFFLFLPCLNVLEMEPSCEVRTKGIFSHLLFPFLSSQYFHSRISFSRWELSSAVEDVWSFRFWKIPVFESLAFIGNLTSSGFS